MGKRQVEGLKWAREREKGPFGPNRARGVKAFGRRYEKELEKAIGRIGVRGQWFEFEDAFGLGWCQTDFIISLREVVLVLEVKYTWVEEAEEELKTLYLPVVEKAMGKEAKGIVVCKNLKPGAKEKFVAGSLRVCAERVLGADGFVPVWHWMGV